ncbi:MAG: lactate racemase domain-containing protein [Chloroflexota bacterium]
MHTVSIPWAMWYETTKFDLTLPDAWDVTVAEMAGGPDIGDAGIRRALAEPIGAPRLRDVARGRRDAVILVDDISRPTPAYRLLPYILEELAAGGLDEDHVIVIAATGTHRPFRRQEWILKIGQELTDRLDIRSHNPCENLEFYGTSSLGFPIWLNRDFARADLKIGAGMIMPRGGGFGGGSKIVLPGVCGRETIYFNHSYCPGAQFTQHTQEVGRICGLEYIVNPLLNPDLGVMALVAGEPIQAFARGVELGKRLYATPVPEGMDIALCNAWPKDNDAHQISLARVPLYGTRQRALKPGATVVTISACSEGAGYHLVMGPGTFFRQRTGRQVGAALTGSGAREVQARNILFAPGVNAREVRLLYGDQYVHCRTWEEVLVLLRERYGDTAKVGVFPCGALQNAAA